ncbi:MAG TPA: GspE/PulE family protein, partial [Candidatus Saccharimonadales bacterium]|nr:GspE/PulE family protein [Candidatus Saccharimonadales bacterium]
IQKNMPLVALLEERKLISPEELTKIQAQVSAVSYVNLANVPISGDILALLPKSLAENYKAVPFGMMQGRLAMAMLDPTNVQAVDFLSRKTGKTLTVYMASAASIDRVLAQYQSDVSGDVNAAIQSVNVTEERSEKAKPTAKTLQTLVQDAPITRALNAILDYAAQSNASDIHIEPREKELKIRYRVDGILQDTMTLPKSVEPALVSRIKILANLKIDEHRVPQDGQFQVKSGNSEVDLRIAIAPVVWGEQIVIRLLDKTDNVLTLDGLGFRGPGLRLIEEGIRKPHGMTLSTGPTGSGKSTTLYAALNAIKNVAINIVTLEDPVEYKMDGINQIQVNPDVGLTFASGLRSILRQDPNVVMVGEIRDKETADLAVQAALTGHVVLSTLHTNSAAGVLPRLLDMGIEPFLIASTVNTVIGQRLVRRICSKCKTPEAASSAEVNSINTVLGGILPREKGEAKTVGENLGYNDLPITSQSAYTLYRANGCSECTKGYRGRLGICEVFALNPAMEKLLAAHATTSQVQAQAQKDGMITMKQDGYLKALSGLTTLEEVARVAADF